MEDDLDDDLYAPQETLATTQQAKAAPSNTTAAVAPADEDEEEGEEADEDESDSDIDIITERKPDVKAKPLQAVQKKETETEAITEQRPARDRRTSVAATPGTAPKIETKERQSSLIPGSSYPAIKTSTIDVDGKPIYEPLGKPITGLDMDSDFPEDDKPWRRPGTDMTDYFNYGFDEFTWASYCLKQENVRQEVTDSKKQMEEMQNFLGGSMPGMQGMPGAQAAGAAPAMPGMPGPNDMPPEMQQMFQQMMAQGVDPMSVDPSQFMQMMQGGNPNQGFGNFGQQGQNQQGYGYGGSGGGGNRGRGQGRRW